MTTKDTGGPAFPDPHDQGVHEPSLGMTMCDYFAAKAMQALLSSTAYTEKDQEWIASMSYSQARAMLAERNKS